MYGKHYYTKIDYKNNNVNIVTIKNDEIETYIKQGYIKGRFLSIDSYNKRKNK